MVIMTIAFQCCFRADLEGENRFLFKVQLDMLGQEVKALILPI